MPIAGPGIIVSDDTGALKCAECGVVVAQFTDTRVLSGILEYLDALPKDNRYRRPKGGPFPYDGRN